MRQDPRGAGVSLPKATHAAKPRNCSPCRTIPRWVGFAGEVQLARLADGSALRAESQRVAEQIWMSVARRQALNKALGGNKGEPLLTSSPPLFHFARLRRASGARVPCPPRIAQAPAPVRGWKARLSVGMLENTRGLVSNLGIP